VSDVLQQAPHRQTSLTNFFNLLHPAGYVNGIAHQLEDISKMLYRIISNWLQRRNRSCQNLIGQKNSATRHQHTSDW